ncbi:MAG TPA: DegV family protein [Thermomicrobiaceae bacterium]|nr:DegV family protein [Thermomicrobiaceae bacterium]
MSGPRPVHIVTDSTSDLTWDLLSGQPITVVPLTVEIGGETFRDGLDLTREEFLARLRAGELPRTSQPPVGRFQQVYQELIDSGQDIVSVHISSGLSGTYNAAHTAARAVAPERIRVVDARTVSMGLGWLALEAAGMAREGKQGATIAEYLEARKADARIVALLDTLEYLRRGGRIGRTSAFLGSALQIKPLVAVAEGEVQPLERVRTLKRALDRLVELAGEMRPWDHLAVLHLGTPEAAATLADRLAVPQPDVELVRAQLGTVIGVYSGPGIMGFAGLVARERPG